MLLLLLQLLLRLPLLSCVSRRIASAAAYASVELLATTVVQS